VTDASQYRDDFLSEMDPVLAGEYRRWYPWCRDTVLGTIDLIGSRQFLESTLEAPLTDTAYEALHAAWFLPYRSYHTRAGKMLRPVLVCLLVQAFGRDPRSMPKVVAIAEMIHAASLVLDDIADDSPLRRGGPTAHQLVGVRVAGASASAWLNACFELLAGDIGLTSAQTHMLIDEITWEHWVTGFGTTIDTTWPWIGRFDRSPAEYLQSVVHRSTSYTYRLPLKIGAIAGGATSEQCSRLAAFGEELGLAFQIIDDVLNVQPGDDRWGKVLAEDITQGKINLQVLLAVERLDPVRRARLTQILASRTADHCVLGEAVTLMRDSGAFDAARDIAAKHVARSKEIAAGMDFLRATDRDRLIAFVDYVINRSR
jgi:geranylgeranyl pyrophosphate synthase